MSENGVEHSGEPVTDRKSKTVMLVAEHGDTVAVDGVGEVTVHKRTETYYGPKLTLTDGERSYRLVAPGFSHGLELWQGIEDGEGFTEGWERVGEVSAEIVDVAPASVCECGETLTTLRERRAASVGVCMHV